MAVSRVLDGDGAGDHGDDAAAACILLSLGERRKEGRRSSSIFLRMIYESFSTFSILISSLSLKEQEYWHEVCICGVEVCSIFSNRAVGGKIDIIVDSSCIGPFKGPKRYEENTDKTKRNSEVEQDGSFNSDSRPESALLIFPGKEVRRVGATTLKAPSTKVYKLVCICVH